MRPRLPKLLSASMESIHGNIPPASTTTRQTDRQTDTNSSASLFLTLLFLFMSLISAYLSYSPFLFPPFLCSSFLAVMEIRGRESLIFCASHRLRVRPSYLGEKEKHDSNRKRDGDTERVERYEGGRRDGVERWREQRRAFVGTYRGKTTTRGTVTSLSKWRVREK